jgi:hypothetical protein
VEVAAGRAHDEDPAWHGVPGSFRGSCEIVRRGESLADRFAA